jgi:transcriptional regulator with XRE-family HTH domain
VKKGNDKFAKNIRILRNSLGLDQAEVAHLVGVNTRTYQKYEYAQTAPSEEKKGRIAEVFKVQVSDLYKDNFGSVPTSASENDLAASLERARTIQQVEHTFSEAMKHMIEEQKKATLLAQEERRKEFAQIREQIKAQRLQQNENLTDQEMELLELFRQVPANRASTAINTFRRMIGAVDLPKENHVPSRSKAK